MSFSPELYDKLPQNWFRRCGQSGLLLPALSLGCWHNFGSPGTDAGHHETEAAIHDNCRAMLRTAFEHGITHFDLANNYGPPPGSAEERVGRLLREDFAAHRDELILSTKAGYRMWPGPYGEWGSRKYLLASLDQSLRRLGVEYVDLFYSHRFDPHTPLSETLGALDSAVRAGKALYAGISSYSGAQTAAALRLCDQLGYVRPIIHQPNYSMLRRGIEQDLLPVTTAAGLGVIAFCPLAQGQLTGKYLAGVPADSRVASTSRPDQLQDDVLAKIRRLEPIAQQRGQSIAQLALTWVLRPQATGTVTSALIGASRPAQIIENVQAASAAPLTEEELRSVEAALGA